VLDGEIVNLKWTWAVNSTGQMPDTKRTPREIPDDIIQTSTLGLSKKYLSDFVTITD
jgi:hypothetical protein